MPSRFDDHFLSGVLLVMKSCHQWLLNRVPLHFRTYRALTSAVLVVLTLIPCTIWGQETTNPVDYAREIAPIFRKYCAGCHNDDDLEGDFSLESYAALQKGTPHGPAFLPEDAENSLLLKVLRATDDQKMPPAEEPQPTAAEIALIENWITHGAKGPDGEAPNRLHVIVPRIESATQVSPITSLDWSSDAIAIARFNEVALMRKLRVLDPTTGKRRQEWQQVQVLTDFPGKVTAAHFCRGGGFLVTASGVTGLGGQATLWEWPLGRRVAQFEGHRDIMLDAEVSPQGDILATCSYDKEIILWDINTGQEIRHLSGHNGAVLDIAFSPDGTALVSASADDTCKVWRVSDGERLDTLGQPLKEQYAVTFSPDGKYIAAGGADNRIRIWEFISRTTPKINPLLHARFAHEGPIVCLAYSPDGSKLISTAEDQTIKVWETNGYTELQLLEDDVDVTMALAIAPDSKSFAVGRMDGSFDYLTIKPARARDSENEAHTVTPIKVSMDGMNSLSEQEPNDQPTAAHVVELPATITGTIHSAAGIDRDCFRFKARAGEEWVLEVNAARAKSPLDSYLEVLKGDGSRIMRAKLQAVRDSYFTFRGKDANQTGDFRVFNWEEMELNEYLYANGEVVKLWLYPRGPDSGFDVYPGQGSRWGYFDTTPLAHALGEPCYIVQPHPPTAELIPNGLPVFPVYYENDDEATRQLGKDSKVHFTATEDGEYIARIRDVRGFQSEAHAYTLTIRPRHPDFQVSLLDRKLTVHAGSAKEFRLSAKRLDDYEGPISVRAEGLPTGWHITSPIVIQEGQIEAMGVLSADSDAQDLTADQLKQVKIVAQADIRDEQLQHDVASFTEVKVAADPQIVIQIVATEGGAQPVSDSATEPLEFNIQAGETIMLKVIAQRNNYAGEISFGKEDSGRNLPHGVYVDNIGLNGLLLLNEQTEREFFITAAKWVPEQTRLFHLRTGNAGGHATPPIRLHIHPSQTTIAQDN